MRLLIQRVLSAKVEISEETVGKIQEGLLVFFGAAHADDDTVIDYLVDKLIHLRIFSDEKGMMNQSLLDLKKDILVVSQFTLYADCSSGRRPSFIKSAPADVAKILYLKFLERLRASLKGTSSQVQTGSFGADMKVSLVNDGPITILLEKDK